MYSKSPFGALGLLGTLVVVAGCTTTTHVPMSDDARSQIESTDVVVGLQQQEIYAEINHSHVSAATGGGLIGALIEAMVDTASAQAAERFVEPVRNALLNYDFGDELAAALRKDLNRLSWLNTQSFETYYGLNSTKEAEAIERSNSDMLIVADSRYFLNPAFDTLKVMTSVRVHPKDGELVAIAKEAAPDLQRPLLYRNEFAYTRKLPVSVSNREEATEAWVASEGAMIRQALSEGVSTTAAMMALDLDVARATYAEHSSQVEERQRKSYDGVTGTVLTDGPDLILMRLQDGTLYAASKK